MLDVKQTIVCRTDLNVKRGTLIACAAAASIKFLVYNDSSDGFSELRVDLTEQEREWLRNDAAYEILGVDSEGAIQELIVVANMYGIETHGSSIEHEGDSTMACIALGPTDKTMIDKVVVKLRPL